MLLFVAVIFLSSGYPLLLAWQAQRRTSLAHAVVWTGMAWTSWGTLLFLAPALSPAGLAAGRYLGLSLIGCAGVAVLGARRPIAGPWNFVVLGLLSVLLLSWAEGLLTGSTLELGGLRAIFLVGTLAVGIGNYLPTRLAPAALLVGAGSVLELLHLVSPTETDRWFWLSGLLFALSPWAGWISLRSRPDPGSGTDRLWLDFRDRYGFVWAQRLQEQFNRSMANDGLPVELRWRGLRSTAGNPWIGPETEAASLRTLQALLKRFGPAGDEVNEPAAGGPGKDSAPGRGSG
jgi:hypothetical protein